MLRVVDASVVAKWFLPEIYKESAERLLGALADRIFVARAAPASKTLALCMELRALPKPLLTVDHPANAPLLGFAGKIQHGTSN
jgi:hypothetical protein